jgi:hypothetical protein
MSSDEDVQKNKQNEVQKLVKQQNEVQELVEQQYEVITRIRKDVAILYTIVRQEQKIGIDLVKAGVPENIEAKSAWSEIEGLGLIIKDVLDLYWDHKNDSEEENDDDFDVLASDDQDDVSGSDEQDDVSGSDDQDDVSVEQTSDDQDGPSKKRGHVHARAADQDDVSGSDDCKQTVHSNTSRPLAAGGP